MTISIATLLASLIRSAQGLPRKNSRVTDKSRLATLLNEVEAKLRRRDYASAYFTMLRPSYLDDLIRIDQLYQGGHVVEIGGYPFCFSVCLQQLGVDLLTVDLAPQRAHDFISEHSLQVVKCDIEREPLPFEDKSVAMITLCATLEHLRVDPIFALAEMQRVLQPDGLLYLTTPNLYRLGNILSFALGRGLAFDPIREYGKLGTVGHMGHVREYTISEIRKFLALAGFTPVAVETRATPSRHGRLVDAVHRLLPRIRTEIVVTARAGAKPATN